MVNGNRYKIIIVVLLVSMVVLPVFACDADRTTLIPGFVRWCVGCCDSDGYSWVEIRGRGVLHHRDRFDAIILLGGMLLIAAGVGTRILRWRMVRMRKNERQ